MGARILFIRTDSALAEEIVRLAGLPHCTFERASGAADALQRLRRRNFDAVVTDPDSGIEEDIALLGELRAARPGVPVLLLAPAARPEDVIEALRARVFACFTAPFEPARIADMVRQAVESADESWRAAIEVTSADTDWISLRLTARRVTGERLIQFMAEMRDDLPDAERDGLMAAFREILFNAIEHGAKLDPDKVIDVAAIRTRRTIVYYVRDPGSGFDRAALPHAAVSNPPDDPLHHADVRAEQGLRPGGFGLLLASRTVDELIYSQLGNEVLLIKYLV
ncbi:MAG: ATP-binding protein [Acidobacteria bacterium]|jgi:anti-sigma regulatory factor (Ser/Thr protein kinase)/CheY-like chemotaxis protein|nr:ATP-binding protein [Acidobacteriota bacterium]